MKLGIVCALPREAHTLGVKVPGGDAVSLGAWGRAMCTGMQPGSVNRCVNTLLNDEIDLVVSWGFAGALSGNLKAGVVVLPTDVVTAGGKTFVADGRAHSTFSRFFSSCKSVVLRGRLYCADKVVMNPGEKESLFASLNAQVVDMESAIVAAAAADRQIPFLAVKSVLDEAATRMPDFLRGAVDDYGHAKPFALFGALLRRPWELGALFVLARHGAKAGRALAALAPLLPRAAAALDEGPGYRQ